MAATNGSYLVTQGYGIVNNAFKDAIGVTNATAIDTSDWVSMGKQLSDFNLLDKFYGSLTNRIAKTIEYVLRYKADGRQILKDSVTYGAFIQKVYTDAPEFVETPAYKVVPDASTRLISTPDNPFGVTQTFSHTVKIFGGSTTYSLEFTQSEILLRKAVTSESEIIALIDSEFTLAKTKMEIAKEELVNDAIAVGIVNASKGGCVRNLLQEYNEFATTKLTRAQALRSAEFLKWANKEINRDLRLMKKPSKKYNPENYLNACDNPICEVIGDFADASRVYLESGTYHADKVALSPKYSELNYWQFNGTSFEDFTRIHIKNFDLWNDGDVSNPSAIEIDADGIIAIARDNDAVACNFEQNYSWSYPNPRARLMAYGYDFEKGYAVDGHADFMVYTMSNYEFVDGENKSNLTSVVIDGAIAVGNKVEIKVTAKSGKTISSVQYSLDGGTTFTSITADSNSKYWLPTNKIVENVKIKVNMGS